MGTTEQEQVIVPLLRSLHGYKLVLLDKFPYSKFLLKWSTASKALFLMTIKH